MAYEIRPLLTLSSLARQAFTQAVTGAIVRVWANTFTVFGKVFALLDFEHEQRRAYLYDQLFASTAAPQWLTRHGFELGLTQDPGNVAVGTVTVPATSGLVVPAGLAFVRADGLTYTTLSGATAGSDANAVDLPISADLAGAAGNLDAGDTLTLAPTSAVVGLGTTATVDAAGLAGGTDPEPTEAFRARILYRKRNPPQGGSAADYVEWAGTALSTVKAVYVDSFLNDARAVWVCFTVSDQTDGIPNEAEIATVQAYVSDPVRRPVTARVFVVAPTPAPVGVTIANLSPDTTDIRAAIEVELEALFADDVRPATPSTPFTLYVEAVSAAIARATGVGNFTLRSPSADQVYATGGQMPTLGSITYR